MYEANGLSSRGNLPSVNSTSAATGLRRNHSQSLSATTTTTTTTRSKRASAAQSQRRTPTTTSATRMTQPSLRRCNAEHCLKTKRRVLKMLLVVVLDFFICWTPLYVVNTMSLMAPAALYGGFGDTGISLVQLLAQASCCCNPITYCFMSSSFRRAFLRAFGCTKIESMTATTMSVTANNAV